jgi:hypothetical protein
VADGVEFDLDVVIGGVGIDNRHRSDKGHERDDATRPARQTEGSAWLHVESVTDRMGTRWIGVRRQIAGARLRLGDVCDA